MRNTDLRGDLLAAPPGLAIVLELPGACGSRHYIPVDYVTTDGDLVTRDGLPVAGLDGFIGVLGAPRRAA